MKTYAGKVRLMKSENKKWVLTDLVYENPDAAKAAIYSDLGLGFKVEREKGWIFNLWICDDKPLYDICADDYVGLAGRYKVVQAS